MDLLLVQVTKINTNQMLINNVPEKRGSQQPLHCSSVSSGRQPAPAHIRSFSNQEINFLI